MSFVKMLKKTPEKIKSFFNGIPIPTYVWQRISNNFILVDFNIAAFNETRGEIKKYIGVKATDFYKDHPDIITDLNQCANEQKQIFREMKYGFRSTSEERFLSVKYWFVSPDLVFVYTEDITRKRHLEDQLKESQGMLRDANKKLRQRIDEKTKELKESEEKYRLISENANDMLIMTNEKFEPEYVNEQALKNLLGYSKEEVIGLSGLKFIHPDDLQKALLSVKNGIEEGQGVTEIRYRHKEGYYVWMEATGKTFTNDMGELKGIFILRDITKRKSIELELKDSEEMYRNIFEKSPNMIVLIDQEGKIVDLNASAIELYGYDKIDFLNKDFRMLNTFPEENYALMIDAFKELLSKGSMSPVDLTFYNKNKSITWVNIQASLIHARGNLLIQAIVQDINEKKEMELKLRESEEKYRMISENANDILILSNEKYKIEYVNNLALKKLLGYSEKEVVGRYGLKFIHPDDIEKAIRSLNKGIEEGQGITEIRAQHKKGHYIWIEATGKTFYDDMGLLKGIIILRDITKRKSIEFKLKESEENYRLITEQSNDLIRVLNEKFEIEYVNERTLKNLLGYTKQEVTGKNSLFLNHPSDYREVRRFMLKLFKYGENTHETRIKHKNGKWVWVENKVKMFADEKGDQKYLLISRDITERKKTEKALKESEEKYRLISENANDILIMTNEKLEIEYINEQALENLLGYSKEEAIGFLRYGPIHPDDIQTALLSIKKGIEEGQGITEIRYRHKKGYYMWMEATGKTFNDDMGVLKGIIILRDITKRKSIELALKESEEKYRLITENVHDLISVVNKKFKYEYINKKPHLNILGYNSDDLIGKLAWRFIHPDDVSNFIIVLKDKEKFDEIILDFRIRHKNGDWIWIRFKGSMFKTENNEEKILLVSRDITTRKKAELKLIESEEKYRCLFEESPYMIILINEKGDIIDFNQNTLKYLIDIRKTDLIGRNFLELNFIPLKHINKLKEMYKDLFSQGFSDTLEFQMDSSKTNLIGTDLKWIEVQTAMVKVGDANLIQVIIQDISERKKWEEKIRESEEMFRKFFEESQDGVLLTDENGTVIRWNKGQERIFGTQKTDIIERPVWDAFFMQIPKEQRTAERYEFLQTTIENVLKTGKAEWLNKLVEVDIQKADGSYQCIQQLPFSIQTSKGFMLGSINRDNTERKIAEHKLIESEERYRAAYEQADFYKNLFAHDISNILFVISGSSQLCSLFLEDPEKAKEVKVNLDRIRDQITRAKLLIKNVQRMSEINNNKPLLKSIDICKSLTKCITYINESYEEKSVEISFDSGNKQFCVCANDLILDVFENLLINAIKYNQNTIKKITIRLTKEEKDGVQFLKMEFIDNGIGITDKRKEIIFQKGHKKDEYTKGMGIGLTLVKIIIDSYNGFIWVEDKVPGDHSKGSNFIILIPLASSEN